MACSNAERFNAEVLRAMAILYKSHPRQTTLDFHDLSGFSINKPWEVDDEIYTQGTLKWLIDNGFIVGDWHSAMCEVSVAQLTASSWALLQRTEQDTPTQTLGQAVVDAAKKGGRELKLVADILMRRMTGG